MLAIDLTGRTYLVCGVHRGGMGGATCRRLGEAGARVIALDRDAAYVEETAAEVRAGGGLCETWAADLMDPATCDGLIAAVTAQFGPLDGLVNVAGGTRGEEWMPLEETPVESMARTMQLNFGYAFALCRDVAGQWIAAKRGGAIVNIGSVSAKDAAPWHGPYGAAKAGLIALTRTMANEWHEFGIRANCVSPGAVSSERVAEKAQTMSDRAKASRDPADKVIFTRPEQLAGAIVFLLSDLASGISGQNLTVDSSLSTKFCAGRRRPRAEFDPVT